jgi:N-acetylglucosamine kinase-like BadF-type ATPase
MEGISNEQYHFSPYLAKDIFKTALEGDDAALDIIRWAGEELGWLAISVARQIEMQDDEVEIIQSGSVFDAGEIIINPMRDIVLKHLPKAKLIRLDGPPVVGAVILGMEQAHFNGYAVRDKMVQTAKEINR